MAQGNDSVVRLPTSAEGGRCSRWEKPSWLDDWRATDLPPAPANEIGGLLAQVEELLSPADEGAIFLVLSELGELFGHLRQEQAQKYLQLLGDIPERALLKAMQRCLRECTAFPWPKEIIERADELHELRIAKIRLETALWRIKIDARRG